MLFCANFIIVVFSVCSGPVICTTLFIISQTFLTMVKTGALDVSSADCCMMQIFLLVIFHAVK